MNDKLYPSRKEVHAGLRELRRLIGSTHWIQGSYFGTEYLKGDGAYEDGAIVEDTKVVGCLVGLAHFVGAKEPTYYAGQKLVDLTDPGSNRLSEALIDSIHSTIVDEFILDYDDEAQDDISVEGWNDSDSRSKEEVLEMLDRTLVREGAAV